jgi:hypothetical protein
VGTRLRFWGAQSRLWPEFGCAVAHFEKCGLRVADGVAAEGVDELIATQGDVEGAGGGTGRRRVGRADSSPYRRVNAADQLAVKPEDAGDQLREL